MSAVLPVADIRWEWQLTSRVLVLSDEVTAESSSCGRGSFRTPPPLINPLCSPLGVAGEACVLLCGRRQLKYPWIGAHSWELSAACLRRLAAAAMLPSRA